MSRRHRRGSRRARGQAMLKAALLAASALVVLVGLAGHLPGSSGFQAEKVSQPTATPVTSAFDETVGSREVTLLEDTWYAIQTGVYSTKEAAESRTALYADRGAPGYAAQDDGKWRVFIACYGEKGDAANVQERLNTTQKVETHLHTWMAPTVTLRLSGMAGQLDVAESGLMMPGQTALLLRDAAIALDAGESSVKRAQQTVQSLGDTAVLWAKTARLRFTAPYPDVITEVLRFADAWAERYPALLRLEDATALSAQLKQCAMYAYDEQVALRLHLLAQE